MQRYDRVQQFFEAAVASYSDQVCVVSDNRSHTYRDLDNDANQLAHYLQRRGVGIGDRVGILLSPSYDSYVCILAVLKANATFVPLDQAFPAERIAFIALNAQLKVLLTQSSLRYLSSELEHVTAIEIDSCQHDIAQENTVAPVGVSDAQRLCYIVYTSGTTGKPKGVAITHANYCHYLSVVPPIYAITKSDRVYQGLTIAFDFSLDEIFPTFLAGAELHTCSPHPADRIGSGLAHFLEEHHITVLHGVPTLLATIDQDIASLRLILLGGETCSQELAARWCKPGRRLLNTYGPTETTITASWIEMSPQMPVTIGKALPTYRIDLRDENLTPIEAGLPGEICIAGPCVAQGYLNRPDETALRFVRDPADPAIRMYRTGDLGRINAQGDIEFLGRIDTQVKIRGYRVELAEIESVLLEDTEIFNALVNPWTGRRTDDLAELVAYLILRHGAVWDAQKNEALYQRLRSKLPGYMVPAYIEVIDQFPVLPSGKANRSALPAPVTDRLVSVSGVIELAADACESTIAEVWGIIFGMPSVSTTANFFNDLGGHSLFAARAVSRLRLLPGFEHVSIRDLYANPSVRELAKWVSQTITADNTKARREQRVPFHRRFTSPWQIRLAGAVQVLSLGVLAVLLSAPLVGLLVFVQFSETLAGNFIKGASVIALTLALSLVLPLVVKWSVIGTFKPGRYPLWGAYFLRWWFVQKTVGLAPWFLLVGTPLQSCYLRLLGCKIGRNCHVASWFLPDLVTLGERVTIGYNVAISPYEISGGWLILAPIHLDDDSYVGNGSMLNHGTRLHQASQVGELAMVSPGSSVPAGEYWDGSPAQLHSPRPEALQRASQHRAPESSAKTLLWSTASAIAMLLLFSLPWVASIPSLNLIAYAYASFGLIGALVALIPAGLCFVLLMCALIACTIWCVQPRLKAGMYPIISVAGFQKWSADRLITISLMVTNSLYATVYAKYWLRALGVRVGAGAEVSTVSFFDPQLLHLGEGCFVADMASLGAATFHRGWFVTAATTVGKRAFVGNAALVPSGNTMGDGSLIGVLSKSSDGHLDAGTSWLGCPAIFLPRRDVLAGFGDDLTFAPRLSLVIQRYCVEFFRVVLPASLLLGGVTLSLYVSQWTLQRGSLVWDFMLVPLTGFASSILLAAIVAALKWAIIGRYRPNVAPLWSNFVWRSELITALYENVTSVVLLNWVTGTPLMPFFMRRMGAHFGNGVYCDSTFCSEFDLVRVASHVSIGKNVSLQTHLFEDRVMKMSYVTIGEYADIGARAVILYDCEIGARAKVGALSLILKAEEIPPDSIWEGIPAQSHHVHNIVSS